MADNLAVSLSIGGRVDPSLLRAITSTKSSIQGLGQSIRRLKASQDEAGFPRFARQIDRAREAQERLLRTQARLRDNASRLRESYVGIAAAAATGFGLSRAISPAIEFESAMAGVTKATNGSAEEVAALGDQLIELTRTIPLTETELAKLATEGAKFGIETSDLPDFVSEVAKISVAFDQLPEEAGQTFARLREIFKIPQGEVLNFAGAIDQLADTSATNEKDIVEVLTRVGSVTQDFGLTRRETAALADTLLALGLDASRSSTAINGLATALQTAETAPPRVAEGLEAAGISLSQLAADIDADPQQAIFNVLNALSQLEGRAASIARTQIFGREFQDEIATLIQGLELYQTQLGRVPEGLDLSQRILDAFAGKLATTQSQLDLTGNAIRRLATVVGTLFLPAIQQAANELANALQPIVEWVKANPELAASIAQTTIKIVAIGTALTAARLAFRLVTGGVLSLIGVFQRLAAVKIAANIATLGTTAATAAGRVGLLSAAVTALGRVVSAGAIGTALVASVTAVVSAVDQAADAMRSARESAEEYRQGLQNVIETNSQFADVQRQQVDTLSPEEFANYDEALKKHEEYWRARLLTEQNQTGVATELTRQRWEAALEELRIIAAAEEQRRNIVQQSAAVQEAAIAPTVTPAPGAEPVLPGPAVKVEAEPAADRQKLESYKSIVEEFYRQNPLVVPFELQPQGIYSGAAQTPPGMASGGLLRGPGTSRSDSILARLSSGEFVTKAKAVQHYGADFFRRLNNMQIPRFAEGGMLGRMQVPTLATASPQNAFTVNIGGGSYSLTENNGQAENFVDALKQQITRRGRRR